MCLLVMQKSFLFIFRTVITFNNRHEYTRNIEYVCRTIYLYIGLERDNVYVVDRLKAYSLSILNHST